MCVKQEACVLHVGQELGYDGSREACTSRSAVAAAGHGGRPVIKARLQESNNRQQVIRQ